MKTYLARFTVLSIAVFVLGSIRFSQLLKLKQLLLRSGAAWRRHGSEPGMFSMYGAGG